jgi:hypothetical protein
MGRIPDGSVDQAIERLEHGNNRILCSELQGLLEQLGFYFKSKSTNNHKVYFHDGLPNFQSAGFNCEHRKDPPVKSPYVQRAKRELKTHREDLIKFLDTRDGKK